MKDDNNRAISYHDKRLMKKVFNAWYFNQVRKAVELRVDCRYWYTLCSLWRDTSACRR